MAAGLGYKEFTTGDVLTAADANGYLASQVVMVFADSAARSAAITSPQEGMISFLKDTNATEFYSGAAWLGVGGSSPLTTKGDVYTFSTVDTRLGVGANGTVLTADSAQATGLTWAAPASGGGLTLLQTLSLSGTSTTSSSLSGSYKNLEVYVKNTQGSVLEDMILRFNSDTGNNYSWNLSQVTGSTAGASTLLAGNYMYFGLLNNTADIIKQTHGSIKIYGYTNTDSVYVECRSSAKDNSAQRAYFVNGIYDNSAAITTITFIGGTSTFAAGSTAYIYGES
jgi:hypothetical protein